MVKEVVFQLYNIEYLCLETRNYLQLLQKDNEINLKTLTVESVTRFGIISLHK